jgi:hypothetical protein
LGGASSQRTASFGLSILAGLRPVAHAPRGGDGRCGRIRAPVVVPPAFRARLTKELARHVDHPHLHRHRHGGRLVRQPAHPPREVPHRLGVLFIIGISGSLIAGIVINLILGDGFKIQPGGIIGSIAVACLLLWLYTRAQNRQTAKDRVRSSSRGGRAHRERKGGQKHHTKR